MPDHLLPLKQIMRVQNLLTLKQMKDFIFQMGNFLQNVILFLKIIIF